MSAAEVEETGAGLDGWVADSRRRAGVPRRVEDADALLAVAHRLLAADVDRDGPGPAPPTGEA